MKKVVKEIALLILIIMFVLMVILFVNKKYSLKGYSYIDFSVTKKIDIIQLQKELKNKVNKKIVIETTGKDNTFRIKSLNINDQEKEKVIEIINANTDKKIDKLEVKNMPPKTFEDRKKTYILYFLISVLMISVTSYLVSKTEGKGEK